jgi:hypothetical protein
MCTVVALQHADGLLLAVNRDELHSRALALPPQVHETDGLHWLAPRDPDGDGTWVAVSDRGVAVVLLNDYHGHPTRAETPIRSRGLLVQDLVLARDLGDVAGLLLGATERLRHTRPFELLAVAEAQALHVHWNGEDLQMRPAQFPVVLTSSVLEPERTLRARRAELALLTLDPDDVAVQHAAIQRWFARHEPGDAPRAVCMHRDIAATVSHTQVEIGRDHVRMRYHPAAPCTPAQAVELALPRQ